MIGDINQIQRHLPHRYPFLLVDKIIELEPGKRAVGIKNVTFNEYFFQGHFPSHPVMPGVLIVEALAQVGGYLIFAQLKEEESNRKALLLGVDEAKFRKQVVPGDVLRLEVEIIRKRGYLFRFQGKAYVDGNLVTEAKIQSMIVQDK